MTNANIGRPFFHPQLIDAVSKGEMTMEQALAAAYHAGVEDMRSACLDKARKMSTTDASHTYHKATGTRVINELADLLMQRGPARS